MLVTGTGIERWKVDRLIAHTAKQFVKENITSVTGILIEWMLNWRIQILFVRTGVDEAEDFQSIEILFFLFEVCLEKYPCSIEPLHFVLLEQWYKRYFVYHAA